MNGHSAGGSRHFAGSREVRVVATHPLSLSEGSTLALNGWDASAADATEDLDRAIRLLLPAPPTVQPRILADARRQILRAWSSLRRFDAGQARSHLDALESRLRRLPPATAESMANEAALIRAAVCVLEDQGSSAWAAVLRCTSNRDASRLTGVVDLVRRASHWQEGNLAEFHRLKRVGLVGDAPHASTTRVLEWTLDAAAAAMSLQLAPARRLATEAMRLAARRLPRLPGIEAAPAVLLAKICYEEGRFEEADALLRRHLEAVRVGSTIDTAIDAFTLLARIACARGQADLALLLLGEAEKVGQERGWARLVSAAISTRLDFLVRWDAVGAAAECADRLRALADRADPQERRIRSELIRAWATGSSRLETRAQPTDSTREQLESSLAECLARHDHWQAVRVATSLACHLAASGRTDEASALTLRVLHVAWRAGLYQSLIDDDRFGALITSVADDIASGARPEAADLLPYVASIVETAPAASSVAPPKRRVKTDRTLHALSSRERSILRAIAGGLSNKEVARQLDIGPETVKSHLKRTFEKLSARTRAEAVARAEILGWI